MMIKVRLEARQNSTPSPKNITEHASQEPARAIGNVADEIDKNKPGYAKVRTCLNSPPTFLFIFLFRLNNYRQHGVPSLRA